MEQHRETPVKLCDNKENMRMNRWSVDVCRVKTNFFFTNAMQPTKKQNKSFKNTLQFNAVSTS